MTKDEALKLEREMKQLREVHAVQGRDGCWDIDDYMLGMFNGLELALCIMENRPPQYKERKALAQPVSSHGNAEDLYVEMSKHLNCPHCGGSGHIDDVAQPEQDGECRYCTHGCHACDARRQSNVLP